MFTAGCAWPGGSPGSQRLTAKRWQARRWSTHCRCSSSGTRTSTPRGDVPLHGTIDELTLAGPAEQRGERIALREEPCCSVSFWEEVWSCCWRRRAAHSCRQGRTVGSAGNALRDIARVERARPVCTVGRETTRRAPHAGGTTNARVATAWVHRAIGSVTESVPSAPSSWAAAQPAVDRWLRRVATSARAN